MNRLRITIPALLLLVNVTCALAQEKEKLDTPEKIEAKVNQDAKQADKSARTAFIDPSLSSPLRFPKLQAKVAATQTDTTAALELNLMPASSADSSFHAGLKLSGPIKKDDAKAELVTLEGLTNQAQVAFSFNWMTPNPKAKFFNRGVFVKAMLAQYHAEHPDKPDDPPNLLMTDLSEKGQAQILRNIGLGSGIWLLGAEGSYAAPTTFTFADPETLAAAKERHDGFSVAASLGWLPLQYGAPYFLGLTYKRVEGYHPQGSLQLCRPFGVDSALECADTVVGAPVKQVANLGQLEMRLYTPDGQIAVNPRLTRDFAKGITMVELPVYFLKDGKGVLNGGLALGWQSDTHAVTLSAFVGSMNNPLAVANQ